MLGLYGGSGTLYVTYEYDSWGNLISMTDNTDIGIGSINPIRYRGYYYDAETGLYYLQSRYYDPQVGRWISADSIIAVIGSVHGCNVFSYCFNNPVNMIDFTGNWPEWIEKSVKAVAAVAVVATGIVLASAVAVGTGGLALAVAGIAFSTTCGGFVGGIANEEKGESFINGWIGGAANGLIQSSFTAGFKAPGTIIGGGIGSGVGTAITEHLNNLEKPKEMQKSSNEILNDSLKSFGIGTIMSAFTAGIMCGIDFADKPGGYNTWASSLKPGVGIAPLTPVMKEMMKNFFSSVDDALIYSLCK